ncbi:MAG: DUF456 domain-containing protein [Candidatus Moraniibacteriota bacterium]|nr:MAG: DUF456 domain-containing protein [Candidatus Moranbacteria bacterium]
MESTVVVLIAWLLIFVGLVGTIVPGLPGIGLVFGGILLYAIFFGVEVIGLTTLIFLGAVTVFSFVIDLLASLYGAKRFGASRAGIIGSACGGLVGLLILNLPGLFLGVFGGAVVGEYLIAKKSIEDALKVGGGSILGFLAGTLIKLMLGIIMVGVFVSKIWF